MLSTVGKFINIKYWGLLYVEHCRKIYLHKILYYDCDSFDPIDKKTGKPFFYLLKHKNGAKLVKTQQSLAICAIIFAS
jgi:hypothetical protein